MRNCSYLLVRTLGICGLLLAATACAPTPTIIETEPVGATVIVNGTEVGPSPVNPVLDFDESAKITVRATKSGYFDEELTVAEGDKALEQNKLMLTLMLDESLKATVPSVAANNWLRLQTDATLTFPTLWQKIVDAVTSRYPSLEMIEPASGYLRSIWIVRKFKSRKGELQVRTRFVGNVTSMEPLLYKLKIEAEARDTGEADWAPFSRIFREDEQLIEEIQGRVGIK
jgi:hypothetical protein